MVLCLFSMGVTKGKWGTLAGILLDFKKDYDANRPLQACLPDIVAAAPDKYGKMGLKDLSDHMFEYMKTNHMDRWQAQAFGSLPDPVMLPREASGRLTPEKPSCCRSTNWPIASPALASSPIRRASRSSCPVRASVPTTGPGCPS
jgi:arginine/lysine/ornithine decarboxylase